jgi:hypothetical protein
LQKLATMINDIVSQMRIEGRGWLILGAAEGCDLLA